VVLSPKSEIRNPKSEIEEGVPAVSADARAVGMSNELNKPAELAELAEPAEPAEPVYKTLDDKIEVGDIVRDREGRLAKKTHWGWDRCGL
jgi:hypothetical protein